MPFSTSRGSRQGRPRRSRRTRGFGKSGARMAHCASVRSMPSSTTVRYTSVSPCRFGICGMSATTPHREVPASCSQQESVALQGRPLFRITAGTYLARARRSVCRERELRALPLHFDERGTERTATLPCDGPAIRRTQRRGVRFPLPSRQRSVKSWPADPITPACGLTATVKESDRAPRHSAWASS